MTLNQQDLDSIKELFEARFISMEDKLDGVQKEVIGLREQIQSLTITLDNFLKRLTDREEEFIILKGEVDKIKSFIKDKFGVEIAIQG
jgi:chromosome segregation ATPase